MISEVGQQAKAAPLTPPALLVLALGLAALAASSAVIFVRFPYNANEGWNALHAVHAMRGGNLYLPDGFANFPNYPPAYFYVLGWLGQIFGDHVFIGRVIALLSQLAIAVNTGLAARALGAGRDGALLAGGLFLLVTALIAPMHMVSNDPQWVGHALQSGALVLLLNGGQLRLPRLLSILALLLAGGLMKQNLAALPLAMLLWLSLRNRRALVISLMASATALALLALLAYTLFGDAIFIQVFGHRREITLANVGNNLAGLAAILPLALIGGLAARAGRKTPPVQLQVIYATLALLLGLVFSAGAGVQANAWFDAAIAVVPLAGLAASRYGFGAPGWFGTAPRTRLSILVLAAIPLLWLAPSALSYYRLRIGAPQFAGNLAPAILAIATAPGPVACEDPTLCYWAGRDNAVDFFNAGQLMFVDPAADERFQQYIATRPLAMIQTYNATTGRLPAGANAAIAASYVPTATMPVHLYVPRSLATP